MNLSGVDVRSLGVQNTVEMDVIKRSKAKAQLEWLRRAGGPTTACARRPFTVPLMQVELGAGDAGR